MGNTEIVSIVVAIIGSSGLVITAYIGSNARQLKAKLEQAHVQIRHKSKTNSFTAIAASWEYIRCQIDMLVKETKADRFLLLSSNNGYLEPRWTTAYVQIREGGQDVFVYRDYEIDDDYRGRLIYIKNNSYAIYKTKDMPKGEVKAIYEREKIHEAFWFYLGKSQIPGTQIFEISFFSLATHGLESFSGEEIQKFISFGNELKGIEREHTGNTE